MSTRPTLGARLVVVCRDEIDLLFFTKLFKAYEGISVVLDRRREQRRRRKSMVAIQQRRRERRAFAVAPVIVVRDAAADSGRSGRDVSQAGLGSRPLPNDLTATAPSKWRRLTSRRRQGE